MDPKDFVRHARRVGTYVGDFEATSLNTLTGKVTGFALKAGDEFAWYPTDGPNAMSFVKLMRIFKPLMEDPEVTWRGHHLKYDIQWPTLSGIDVQNRLFCTMVASWMLNEDRMSAKLPGQKPSKYGLKKLIFEHFGHKMHAFDEADSLFGPDLSDYAMDDVRQTDLLADLYEEGLADDKLEDVYWKIEAPMIPILADMEITGMKVDLKRLRAHRAFLMWSQEHVRNMLFKELGHRFDPNSPPQVARVLYEELGLPTNDEERPVAMGKSGQYSTSKETLKLFANDYPIVRIMLEDRHISVLLNTFCKKINRLTVRSHDGRLRCSWKQHGTRIGRLSSADPNFQNFPRPDDFSDPKKSVIRRAWPDHLWRSEWDSPANTIRGCFVAEHGNSLLDADLSQIELRMMAHWSEDPTMLGVYLSGGKCTAGKGGEPCQDSKDQKAGKRKDKCRHVDIHSSTAEGINVPRSPIAKCLDASTLVVTDRGLQTIQSVVGDHDPGDHRPVGPWKMADARGGWVLAEQGIVRHKRPTKIVVTRRALVVATEDHRFQLLDGTLLEAQHLEAGMKLPIAEVPVLTDGHDAQVFLNPFTKEIGSGPAVLMLDENWAYFAGMFAGDGSISKNACRITHGADERYAEWRESVREACTVIGLPVTTNTSRVETIVGSKVVRCYLSQLEICDLKGEHGHKTMRVPSWVLSGRLKTRWSYLAGLWDTDGTVAPTGTTSFTTKYPEFAGQVAFLLRTLGLPVSIQPQFNKGYERWYYTVHVLGAGLRMFLEHCPLRYREKREKLEHRVATIKRELVPPGDEVLLVLDGGERTVYDVQVENEDHLYLQGGLVGHNNINFGACYRIGPRRLKSYAEVDTVANARRFLQDWYDAYPGVVSFHEWVENHLKKNSWQIRTMTGRLRRLLKDSKENDYKAITQGIQFVISGSSQDLLKIGMRNYHQMIREARKHDPAWAKLHFCAQVHDQVTCEGPDEIADDALKALIKCLEEADGGALMVPVTADGGKGKSWSEAH